MKQNRGESGFTLIEIMIVVAILALLAALVGPRLMGQFDKAKVDDAKVQIRNLESALKFYKMDNGNYPTTEQGLKALVEKPAVGQIPKSWREGGYLESRQLPQDPWKNDFVYLSPGEHGDYDLYSLGADGLRGGEGTNADIESWSLR
jgi:general secretion pathway protein G